MENITFLDYLATRDEDLYVEYVLNEAFECIFNEYSYRKKPKILWRKFVKKKKWKDELFNTDDLNKTSPKPVTPLVYHPATKSYGVNYEYIPASFKKRIILFLITLLDLTGYQADRYINKYFIKNPIVKNYVQQMKTEMEERQISFENDLAIHTKLEYIKEKYKMSEEAIISYINDPKNENSINYILRVKREHSQNDKLQNDEILNLINSVRSSNISNSPTRNRT